MSDKTIYSLVADLYQNLRNHLILNNEMSFFLNELKGNTVLDAGCGPGRDINIFLQKGINIIGIDNCSEFVEKASLLSKNIIKMDILSLQFPENYFNGVWCNTVLPHFSKKEVEIVLRNFNKVLTHKGVLFNTIKIGKYEGFSIANDLNNIKRYICEYEKDEFDTYLKKAGFKIIQKIEWNERDRFGGSNRDINFISYISETSK